MITNLILILNLILNLILTLRLTLKTMLNNIVGPTKLLTHDNNVVQALFRQQPLIYI